MGVFGGTQVHGGSARADLMTFEIGGREVKGMVIQNVQFTFTQQVNMLYEIGSGNVYFVGGRAQGTATVARIIGPGKTQLKLLNKYKDMCDPKDIKLGGSSMCTKKAKGVDYTLVDAILTSIGASVSANDVMINEQLNFMFVDLVVA